MNSRPCRDLLRTVCTPVAVLTSGCVIDPVCRTTAIHLQVLTKLCVRVECDRPVE